MTTVLSGRGCVPWPGLYSGYEQMTFSRGPANRLEAERLAELAANHIKKRDCTIRSAVRTMSYQTYLRSSDSMLIAR